MTSDELVKACLEVLGPLDVLDTTENGLREFASKYGNLAWNDSESATQFDRAALSVIQLIDCTQEYQTV